MVSKVRKSIPAIVLLVVVTGMAAGYTPGSICTLGYDAISAMCPLGALELLLSGREFGPRLIASLAVGAVVILLVGKAFCGWICPIPPIDRLLTSKKAREEEKAAHAQAARRVGERCRKCGACASEGNLQPGGSSVSSRKWLAKVDGRYLVLGGSLISAMACGFPVFCLVCPVGLVFATAIALYRLVGFNEPTIDLIVFPLVILAEVTLLRRWCHRFCPLGALLSLAGRMNGRTRPQVNASVCLREKGVACTTCSATCPEFIDLPSDAGDRPRAECTRCGKCIEACPVSAINFRKTRGLNHVQKR